MQITHSAFLECKARHVNVSRCLWRFEYAMTGYVSTCKTAKLHRMEIDKVEDIADINILQVGHEIVGRGLGCNSIYIDVLEVVLEGEMVDA